MYSIAVLGSSIDAARESQERLAAALDADIELEFVDVESSVSLQGVDVDPVLEIDG